MVALDSQAAESGAGTEGETAEGRQVSDSRGKATCS